MDLGIADKVALVTGSSQGIGDAAVRCLAREGTRVAITYHTEKRRADDLAERIISQNGDAMVVFFDLASPDSIAAAIRQILGRWGRIDILVNNAIQWSATRIAEAPPFEEYPIREWQPLLRANIEGVYCAIQGVLPSMRERRWGRIVNISSVVAEDGLRGSGWYSMVKASLHGLTRTLSRELGPAGILVNSVMPGLTGTDRIRSIAPETRRRVEENSPLRRVLTPEEVAATVVFLCSAMNSSVTGEIIRIGGRS